MYFFASVKRSVRFLQKFSSPLQNQKHHMGRIVDPRHEGMIAQPAAHGQLRAVQIIQAAGITRKNPLSRRIQPAPERAELPAVRVPADDQLRRKRPQLRRAFRPVYEHKVDHFTVVRWQKAHHSRMKRGNSRLLFMHI